MTDLIFREYCACGASLRGHASGPTIDDIQKAIACWWERHQGSRPRPGKSPALRAGTGAGPGALAPAGAGGGGMSAYRTGADAERLAAMRLTRIGYVVHLAGHRGEQRDGVRIPYGADLFQVPDARGRMRGLFDLVALGPTDTRWVQVKAVRSMTSPPAWWRQAVEALPLAPAASYELWLLVDGHWRIWRLVYRKWEEAEVAC